jgi:hypothetical protein
VPPIATNSAMIEITSAGLGRRSKESRDRMHALRKVGFRDPTGGFVADVIFSTNGRIRYPASRVTAS